MQRGAWQHSGVSFSLWAGLLVLLAFQIPGCAGWVLNNDCGSFFSPGHTDRASDLSVQGTGAYLRDGLERGCVPCQPPLLRL